MTYALSLLDKTPLIEGETAGAALQRTVSLAQAAERLGYHRFWLAEHYDFPGLVSPAPEVFAAYLLARRARSGDIHDPRFAILNSLLDPIFMLPLGTSAVTLGLGYIVALGRPPLNLIRSPLLIPTAHALLAFPFVLRSLLPTLRALDPRLREAARTLGASPRRVFREVDLPLGSCVGPFFLAEIEA